MEKPRQIGEILNASPLFQHLSQRAQAAQSLCDQVKAALPAHLALHITGAEQRQQELIVWADSAAFCTHLRFELPRLQTTLARETGASIEKISVQVQPRR